MYKKKVQEKERERERLRAREGRQPCSAVLFRFQAASFSLVVAQIICKQSALHLVPNENWFVSETGERRTMKARSWAGRGGGGKK